MILQRSGKNVKCSVGHYSSKSGDLEDSNCQATCLQIRMIISIKVKLKSKKRKLKQNKQTKKHNWTKQGPSHLTLLVCPSSSGKLLEQWQRFCYFNAPNGTNFQNLVIYCKFNQHKNTTAYWKNRLFVFSCLNVN